MWDYGQGGYTNSETGPSQTYGTGGVSSLTAKETTSGGVIDQVFLIQSG